jgi:hypothetical protein
VRGLGSDPGQAERLGDGGDDRHGTVGRDGEDAVDAMRAGDGDDAIDVSEVDDLGRVRQLQSQRLGVPVDGHDAQPELLRARDRAPLVAPGADEEDRPSAATAY